MKLSIEQIKKIKDLFIKMNSKTDFLNLLNMSKQIYYGEKTVPFEEKQLNYFINKDSISKPQIATLLNKGDKRFSNQAKKSMYVAFTIKKKSGADRTIHAPIKGLKEFQKALNIVFQCVYQPHEAANGFVLGKSIVDNASKHTNQNYVYNIDLKDFFPSIDKSRVWGRLLVEPFNLGKTPERKKIANMMAVLCCNTMKVERFIEKEWKKDMELSVLPQGAPTSPTLTNAICEKLDLRLTGVAKRFGLNYSRYADDITFSSMHNSFEIEKDIFENIYTTNSTFNKEIKRIIEDQKFHIKESKVRLQKRGYRQEVTGIVVNDKINVNRKYINELRKNLYLWETYGYEKAYTIFLQKYNTDKGHIKKGKPNMMMVLEGKLLYLKMVKGENNSTYTKLKERLDSLNDTKINIVEILKIWESDGIEKAMEVFYSNKKIV